MQTTTVPYTIFPLGDSALTIDYGNRISDTIHAKVMARWQQLRSNPVPGTIDLIPAYSSLTIYYDRRTVQQTIPTGISLFDWVQQQVENRLQEPFTPTQTAPRLLTIPVCYEPAFAIDIEMLAATNHLTVDTIIQLHTSKEYIVYMLGFLPGFAYMGEVDDAIVISRKPQPVTMAAGSVGIAGKQTGIYPFQSPGGWQIIGCTPLHLFDAESEMPTFFQAGDRVQFRAISEQEFYELKKISPQEQQKNI